MDFGGNLSRDIVGIDQYDWKLRVALPPGTHLVILGSLWFEQSPPPVRVMGSRKELRDDGTDCILPNIKRGLGVVINLLCDQKTDPTSSNAPIANHGSQPHW